MYKHSVLVRCLFCLLAILVYGTPAAAQIQDPSLPTPPPPDTANWAPELTAIGNQAGSEGALLTFTVTATDANSDVLTYSASGLPLGASFDAVTRIFSWTPGFDQAGSYMGVTFTVSDGTATDSETITITITNTNRAPVVTSPGAQQSVEGTAVSLQLAASDPDGDGLTYSAAGLPPGIGIDATTGLIAGTVSFDGAATSPYTVTVAVGDSSTSSTAVSFNWTVTNTNRAPELTAIGNQAGNEGALLTFTVGAIDADGDVLTYSATGLPLGASFDPVMRTFSWTPGFGQAGSYMGVTFTVSDGTATDNETITITVDPPTANAYDKLDPLLQFRALEPSGTSEVIVRAQDAASMDAVALLIQQVGGTLGLRLPIINAQAAEVPNLSLSVLADSPNVQRLALDRPMLGTLERTGVTVGAAAIRQQLGYDGAGIGVAVIDSGVTSWHDDLTQPDAPGAQRVRQFVDFVGQRSTPYDDYGHGTHVAGIIAGNGFDTGGARSGIAPGAHLIVLKVLDGSGNGRISNVIAALDYVITYREVYQIRVVNLSIAAAVHESYHADFLTLATKRVVDHGIVVVASAGNIGRDAQGNIMYGGITAPGNAPWVATIGASSHMGSVDPFDDTIARFTSRGPTAIDGLAKPDVVAPGVGIYSLSDPSSFLYTSKAPYLLSGTVPTSYLPYLSLSGTSQAAPVVAGTVALMLQANPGLTPNAVKAILQYTAEYRNAFDPLSQGAGFLNAGGAIELARFFAAPLTSSYPSGTLWSRQLIWGNHRVQNGFLMPDATAWLAGVVWGDARTPDGQNVSWGVICDASTNCESGGGTWVSWQASCLDAACSSVVWGAESSQNVVWGSACGGSDCQGTSWSTMIDVETVVWGSSDWETVVWGSSDFDTVVWGSSCSGSSCESVIWEP